MEVQPRGEPEEILQAVVDGEPMVREVHQLDTGLHDPGLLLKHHRVHDAEDIGIDIVFCVEDGDHLVASLGQADVQGPRLVDRRT